MSPDESGKAHVPQKKPGNEMRIYLVGGAVRDELLGCRPPDRDYVVIGATEETFRLAYPGAKKVGRQGRCVFLHRGREFTLSDQPDIWADLQLRDLTINAAAKDEQGRILATERTRGDLHSKILRPVHPDNFRDDPLRCYRAARMASCFPDFTFHSELKAVLRDMAESRELDRVAAERVCCEVRKACACRAPGRFLRVLVDYGLFASWFSELDFLETDHKALHADPNPDLPSAADLLDRLRDDPLRVWMGMSSLLDAAAPMASSRIWNAQSAEMARNMAQRLKMPVVFIRAAEKAAGWIRAASGYTRLPPEARVDLLTDLAAHELSKRMLAIAAAISDDADPQAWRDDLRRIQEVRLPRDKQGLGPESGRILRKMRCERLYRG